MTDESHDLITLRAEVAALRAELAEVRAARTGREGPARAPVADHRGVTRRGLLAAAVAGGVGLVAEQVTTAAPAAAAAGGPVVMGANNDGGGAVTILTSGAGRQGAALGVVNPDPTGHGIGVYAQLGNQSGLINDQGVAAVVGDSHDGIGVSAYSVTNYAIFAQSNSRFTPTVFASSANSTAVVGSSLSSSAGIYGNSSAGPGVRGESFNAEGLRGESTNGPGATAQSTNGTGLVATGGAASPGIDASSANGYGVLARGARAPLRLVPSTRTGAPTTGNHQLGELFVDKLGVLYLCTVKGAPGTWKRVSLI